MSDALIEKKFQLLKSIWIYFITEKVSISLPLLPGNVRIILKETIGLIDELNTVKTDKQKKSLIKRIFNRDFCIIPKAENIGVLVAQKKDFTPHFVELISD